MRLIRRLAVALTAAASLGVLATAAPAAGSTPNGPGHCCSA